MSLSEIPTLVASLGQPVLLAADSVRARLAGGLASGIVVYTARLDNGEALPAGWSIDAATGTLTGRALADSLGAQTVRITATDATGQAVSALWTINTTAPPGVYLASSWVLISDYGASGASATPGDPAFRPAAG
ncbi:MAG: putative Ig domain, partial [Pseudomonadota bacterium]